MSDSKTGVLWHATALSVAAVASLLMSAAATAASFTLPAPDVDIIGDLQMTQSRYADTLLDIARRYGLGYEDITLANPGVDPWLPGEGTAVTLPTRFILPGGPREGVVINVAELRLYYYPQPKPGEEPAVITYPISIGRMDWQTPIGMTKITAKVHNPTWYPPKSVRDEHEAAGDPLPPAVPPGKANPLGEYAIKLDIPGYLIHGTNRPDGVGMRVTHGCIRMYPEDIEALAARIPLGTPVRIINEPYKMGWAGGLLYLEAHPPLEEDLASREKSLTRVTELYVAATQARPAPINWYKTQKIFKAARGIPVDMSTSDAEPEYLVVTDEGGETMEAAGATPTLH
ncbi:MAG: L,D-transpeptidase family protein [Gammaproteobacteria bacterium]